MARYIASHQPTSRRQASSAEQAFLFLQFPANIATSVEDLVCHLPMYMCDNTFGATQHSANRDSCAWPGDGALDHVHISP